MTDRRTLMTMSLFLVIHLLVSSGCDAGEKGGGVLLYFKDGETVWLLLGYERSGYWCDFGGGCWQEETTQEAALRELKEETRNVFGDADTLVKLELGEAKNQSRSLNRFQVEVQYDQYLVKTKYVPTTLILNNPVPDIDAYKEVQNYAWIPLSEIQRALSVRKSEADPLMILNRGYLPPGTSPRVRDVFIGSLKKFAAEPEKYFP